MLTRNLLLRHRLLLPDGGSSIRKFSSAAWPPASRHPRRPPRPYNPMASYLARACGFSFDEAVAAAKLLSGNKATRDPSSSSSSSAFSGKSPLETQIGWLVSSAAPPPGGKKGAAEDVGFSGRTLAQLTLLEPGALTGANASRKIGFWCALFRAEADLLRVLVSNTRSAGSSSKGSVVRKMILLRGCGVPDGELRALLRRDNREVARSVDSLEVLINRIEELGLARGRSAAYEFALGAISALNETKLEAKLGKQRAPRAVGKDAAFGISSDGSAKNAGKGRNDGAPSNSSIPLALGLEKKVMPPYYALQMLKYSAKEEGEDRASYLLRMCKKARLWTNSYAEMNREFQSFMELISLLVVRGRAAV